jgi:hypothetical protein
MIKGENPSCWGLIRRRLKNYRRRFKIQLNTSRKIALLESISKGERKIFHQLKRASKELFLLRYISNPKIKTTRSLFKLKRTSKIVLKVSICN